MEMNTPKLSRRWNSFSSAANYSTDAHYRYSRNVQIDQSIN